LTGWGYSRENLDAVTISLSRQTYGEITKMGATEHATARAPIPYVVTIHSVSERD